jgi:hypothetical protein
LRSELRKANAILNSTAMGQTATLAAVAAAIALNFPGEE